VVSTKIFPFVPKAASAISPNDTLFFSQQLTNKSIQIKVKAAKKVRRKQEKRIPPLWKALPINKIPKYNSKVKIPDFFFFFILKKRKTNQFQQRI